MIFAKTWRQVLDGTKTQTLRLAYPGDELLLAGTHSLPTVFEAPFQAGGRTRRRIRWRVGGTYAVQPERCHAAVGRIEVVYLRDIPDPTAVLDEAFAKAEGMASVEEFLRVWHELHRSEPRQRCWAIGFTLVRKAEVPL